MNLFESDVWSRPNTGPRDQTTVLDLAQQEDLAVLVNRPLNAMPSSRAGMLRLADVPLEGETGNIDEALRAVGRLGRRIPIQLAAAIPHGGKGLTLKSFSTGRKNWPRYGAVCKGWSIGNRSNIR